MADDLVTIKKIRTAAGDHLIDATYLGGHTFAEIEGMVHGGIETYVIPLSKKSVSGYATIVNSTESTLTTTKTVLDSLIEGQAKGGYKLGDVILIEATSDGKKVFDVALADIVVGIDINPYNNEAKLNVKSIKRLHAIINMNAALKYFISPINIHICTHNDINLE